MYNINCVTLHKVEIKINNATLIIIFVKIKYNVLVSRIVIDVIFQNVFVNNLICIYL